MDPDNLMGPQPCQRLVTQRELAGGLTAEIRWRGKAGTGQGDKAVVYGSDKAEPAGYGASASRVPSSASYGGDRLQLPEDWSWASHVGTIETPPSAENGHKPSYC